MYRLRTVLIFAAAFATVALGWHVRSIDFFAGTDELLPLPPSRPLLSMGARPPYRAPYSGPFDWNAYAALKQTAPALTPREQYELENGLSLTIVVDDRRVDLYESPVVRGFLRNNSPHTAVLMSGSERSASGMFPLFNWKVTFPNGTTDRPTVGGCGNAMPPGPGCFTLLAPGEEMEIITMDIQVPLKYMMTRAGDYTIQLEYSTDPEHPNNGRYYFEDYRRMNPVMSTRVPSLTVKSNVVSVNVGS